MRLLILFATQSGNAEEAASKIGREAIRRHFQVDLKSIDSFVTETLPNETMVLFVVSTTGQGEVPDQMKKFWKFLLQKRLPSDSLKNLKFGVFGLGDTTYPHFNFAAKKLQRRLESLGGFPIIRRGDADDQHRLGWQGELKDWLKELWESLKSNFPNQISELSPIPQNQLLHSRYHVSLSNNVNNINNPTSNISTTPISTMKLIESKRITKEDWEQDVREFIFDISEHKSSFEFQVGDAVQILPRNLKGHVDKLLERLKLDGNLIIQNLEQRANQHHHHHEEQQQQHSHPVSQIIHQSQIRFPLTLRELLDGYFDLQKPPNQYFFEIISHFASAEHEKEKLEFFASSEGQDDLNWYSWKEKRTPIEVLIEFPSISNIPLEYVFDLFPRIIARSFSISSSPRLRNNRIHLTVGIVKYKTPLKRNRYGLCSNYLASLDIDSKVNAWIRQTTPELSNLLKTFIPSKNSSTLTFDRNNTPLIMIGPGTGCAIFHALLEDELFFKQQSQIQPTQTRTLAFFFGCRHKESDYLHGQFWEKMKEDGILNLLDVAFSRDPIPTRVSESTKMKLAKVYVQFLIPLHSKQLFDLIFNKGAAIIISGSANRMPIDIKEAFVSVLQKEGNMDEQSAKSFIENMQKQNKYQEETWS